MQNMERCSESAQCCTTPHHREVSEAGFVDLGKDLWLSGRQNTPQWVCRYVLPHCSVWDGYHPGREPYSISISYSVTFSCAAALSHWSRPPGCTPGLNSASSDLENILNSNVTGLASTGAKAAKLWHLKLAWTVFLLDLVLVEVNFFFFSPTLWQISQADVFSFHHMTLHIFPCGVV